jgi:ABC-2 type transport system ATP-binding protein
MLSCLLKPSGGRAMVLGHDVAGEAGKVKSLIGVSPQETAVAPRLTAFENLVLIAGCYGLDRPTSRRRAEALLAAMDLEDRAKDRASTLSGGMERRLSIAMAMVADPPVLFLDEPTLGLDPDARQELWGLLRGFNGEKTILLTTHYLEEAERLASRMAVLVDGGLAAEGSPEELKRLAPGGGGSLEEAYLALVHKELRP